MIEIGNSYPYEKENLKGFGAIPPGSNALGTKLINIDFIIEIGQHFELKDGKPFYSGSWLKINDGINIQCIFTEEDYSDLKLRLRAVNYEPPVITNVPSEITPPAK